MIAIIIKEFRENLKWAALIAIALGALMVYALGADQSPSAMFSYYYYTSGPSILGLLFSAVSCFGFAAAGLALGLIQVLQDSGPGRWGFLTHRPISRSRIFWGKVVTGLCLYILATAIPLAASVIWVATPGHLAVPFEWHMVLPRAADFVAGLAWYAAGLMVAARPARWIGSRLMPLGIAFGASAFESDLAVTFLQACLGIALAFALLLASAYSVFVSSRQFHNRSILDRIFQLICVAPGLILVMFAGESIIAEGVSTLGGRALGPTFHSSMYEMQKTGRIVRRVADNTGLETFFDLDGKPIREFNSETYYRYMLNLTGVELLTEEQLPPAERRDRQRFTNAFNHVEGRETVGTTAWFYIPQRKTIEAYDTYQRRFIGSIGPQGYSPAPAIPESFSRPLEFTYFEALSDKTNVYHIDLDQRQIKTYFTSPSDDPIHLVIALVNREIDAANRFVFIAVVTQSHIHILHPNGDFWFTVPREMATPSYEVVEMGRTTDGRFIFWYRDWRDYVTRPHIVVQTDSQGHILKRESLPLLPPNDYHNPFWRSFLDAFAGPPAIPAIQTYDHRFSDIFNTPTIAAVITNILLAIAILLWQFPHYDLTKKIKFLWLVLSLFLGSAAALLLLSLHERQALVRCPSCGKKRLVSQENCENCRAPFAPPPTEGIEVFEMA